MIGFIAPVSGISFLIAAFFWWSVRPSNRRQLLGFILAGTFVVALTALIYSYLGSYHLEAEHQFQLTHATEINDNVQYFREHPNELVNNLRAEVEKHPNELRGWMLLGRVYASSGEYQEASKAFARALVIDATDDGVVLSYLQAKALCGPSAWQEKETNLLKELLNRRPNDPSILHLQASREFTDKQYAEALQHWQAALANLPENETEGRDAITQAIARVKQMVSTPIGKQVKIACDLGSELKSRYSPDTTVLIYAKALNGPPMPLAVVKRQVKDLPLTVTLSDQDAMLPNMNLSKFDDIELFARVSQSGQAQPEKGDAIGSVTLHGKGSVVNQIRIRTVI